MNIRQNARVCSTHFPGGKKTYLGNIPTEEEICEEECPENENVPTCNNRDVHVSEVDATTILPIISRESEMKEEIDTLKTKCDALQKTIDAADKCSFRLERFIGSDHDFKFYTGFADYTTFSAFFDYLSPTCQNLIYYGSNTSLNSASQTKRGKPRLYPCRIKHYLIAI
jgi:hypothetical protein